MEVRIENIGPELAEEYLRHNTKNRKLTKSIVGVYAQDMRNGNWKLTHQGIAFNCDGTLLDGQHRLRAIIESGKTIQMVVARGVGQDSQIAMDDHKKRSAGDALTLARDETITDTDCAIVRAIVELSGSLWKKGQVRLSKHEINKLLGTLSVPLAFAKKNIPGNQRGIKAAPIKAAVALAWYYVDDIERLEAFCKVLCGETLADGVGDRAAVTLREWVLRTGACSSGDKRRELFSKTQRAIVAFVKRHDVAKLYGTTVFYPWPLIEPVRT